MKKHASYIIVIYVHIIFHTNNTNCVMAMVSLVPVHSDGNGILGQPRSTFQASQKDKMQTYFFSARRYMTKKRYGQLNPPTPLHPKKRAYI